MFAASFAICGLMQPFTNTTSCLQLKNKILETKSINSIDMFDWITFVSLTQNRALKSKKMQKSLSSNFILGLILREFLPLVVVLCNCFDRDRGYAVFISGAHIRRVSDVYITQND